MNGYRSYFDRQTMPDTLKERLLSLEPPKKRRGRTRWAALAACCLLAAGTGLWRLGGLSRPAEPFPLQTAQPSASPPALSSDASLPENAFVVEDSGEEPMNLPVIWTVECPDVTGNPVLSADIALPQGHFTQSLTRDQVVKLFGQERETLPWMLFWEGCTVWGKAIYDGTGSLWQAFVYGTCDAYSFTLTLRPGETPVRDTIVEGWAETDVNGTAVRGLSLHMDQSGDGGELWRYEVEFLRDGVGVCFAVEAEEANQAAFPASLFVTCTAAHTDSALTLDHVLTCPEVPQWISQSVTLEEARSDPEFGAFLPQSVPSGFSFAYGHRELGQDRNFLSVRWDQGMAEITLLLQDPAAAGRTVEPVDLSRPETYDRRLYTIPLADSVPEEYRESVNRPVFRAGDMSREVVEARAYTVEDQGDVSGLRMHFCVLYSGPSGAVLAEYTMKGVTVEEAWAMLEPLIQAQTQTLVYN